MRKVLKGKKKEDTFVDLVRSIFEACGIAISGELIVERRFLGEGIIRNVRIYTLETYVRLFGEGKYIFQGEDVEIKGVDPEPFYINYMCIEGEYKDAKWDLVVRMDEEEILYADPEKLEARSITIARQAKTGIETLTSLLRLAEKVLDLTAIMSGLPA